LVKGFAAKFEKKAKKKMKIETVAIEPVKPGEPSVLQQPL
jgi:hypothetical protein